MPRRGNVPKREVLPDPIYNSVLVTKLGNSIMLDGKKGVAQKVVYGAFDIIKEKTEKDPLDVFTTALENIMPSLEVKARRGGGATYQVPIEVRPERRQTLGLRGSREELGEKKGDIDEKDITVEYSDDQYTVVVPVSFEKNKANFTYVFDKSGTPTSLTVDVNYTLAQNMEKAAMNTVMGLGTVFVILVFLIFVISLFKYIPGLVEGKKKESKPAPAAAAPAPVAAPVAEPAVEDVTDDGELIAVIAAAIAASEGKTSTDGFVVRSIRKVNRRKR